MNGTEAAYPRSALFLPDGPIYDRGADGLTKREYFAGHALQGMLASERSGTEADYAYWAVGYANALLVELDRWDAEARAHRAEQTCENCGNPDQGYHSPDRLHAGACLTCMGLHKWKPKPEEKEVRDGE